MRRDVDISGSFNSRDLGGYNTPTGKTAWKKVYRSGSMSDVDHAGLQMMRDLKITRVIDLRSPVERIAAPDPFGPENGIELINFSLFDKLAPTNLHAPDMLLQFYMQALENQGSTFVKIINAISTSKDAVLFHCTAGKDRTGLVAALILSIAEVSNDDIISDYILSKARLRPLLMQLEQTVGAVGLKKADVGPMFECPPEIMHACLTWLEKRYGSAADYLLASGQSQTEINAVRKMLC